MGRFILAMNCIYFNNNLYHSYQLAYMQLQHLFLGLQGVRKLGQLGDVKFK